MVTIQQTQTSYPFPVNKHAELVSDFVRGRIFLRKCRIGMGVRPVSFVYIYGEKIINPGAKNGLENEVV